MSTPPDPLSPFGPERAGEPPRPIEPDAYGDLTAEVDSPDDALELFQSLLLIAASAPVGEDLTHHPLMLVQAAKAMIGLRPETPSEAMITVAMEACKGVAWTAPDRASLSAAPDQLGLTVSVHDLELALMSGDSERAANQLARVLLVSDSRLFLFDVILSVAARDPERAAGQVAFVHSCQRAYAFIGPLTFGDFILPALQAVTRQKQILSPENASFDLWEALPKIAAGSTDTLLLAAHSAQIEADEHIKGTAIMERLGRVLADQTAEQPTGPFDKLGATGGTPTDLQSAARAGEVDQCRAIGRRLAETGERVWLLDILEAAKEIMPPLLLWADSIRMLLRVAPESERGAVGEVAGAQLARILS